MRQTNYHWQEEKIMWKGQSLWCHNEPCPSPFIPVQVLRIVKHEVNRYIMIFRCLNDDYKWVTPSDPAHEVSDK